MANTVIQLKYSTVTATPSALNVAEPAYSYSSNTLFIGSPAGTGSIAIGGKFYLDQQASIYNLVNAAFTTANAAGTSTFAQDAYNKANGAFDSANVSTAVNLTQNNSITAAFTQANTAVNNALSASTYANTGISNALSASNYANGAFTTANTALNTATAAYARANSALNANTGGTITGSLTVTQGDLSVTGNLYVLGSTTSVSSNVVVIDDTLIYIANNNPANLNEIGFIGHFTSGTYQHTGLVRDHADNKWKLFSNVAEPGATTVSFTNAVYDTLKLGTIEAATANVNGVDLLTYTTNAFNQANTAVNNALSASNYANGAFTQANTAVNNALSASNYANGAFATANTAAATNLTQNNSIAAAFSLANGTALIANTDYTNVNITSADYGSASGVASFRVAANGRIISANTTSIAIDAGAVTSGTLAVARGGTGVGTFTQNGVLLGQGTSALQTASSSTEGHVLTINNSGVPTFSHLQGGTF